MDVAQGSLFEEINRCGERFVPPEPAVNEYERVVVFFSGGKDSVACFLLLLDMGVPRNKIELHHHLVDGRESEPLMDWPVTEDYCRKFAAAFGVPIFFSWKEGGFEREMNRNGTPTAPIRWDAADGALRQKGGEGPLGVRRRFPQVSADLSVRWCSSYLKIDVGCRVLTNEPRFQTGKTLVVTGERAEESSERAKYKTFEPHRSDNRAGKLSPRYIDHWRPVHQWTEKKIWILIEKWAVNPHPAYHLGWGRTSCALCIFGSAKQFASALVVLPEQFARVSNFEREFGVTIKRNTTIRALANAQTETYAMGPEWVAVARSSQFDIPILVQDWKLPQGAYGESTGPTRKQLP